jgi:hypothetical protein
MGLPNWSWEEILLGRGKVLCLAVKYWLRILQIDKKEFERECYEWQLNNLKFRSWARKVRKSEKYDWDICGKIHRRVMRVEHVK